MFEELGLNLKLSACVLFNKEDALELGQMS